MPLADRRRRREFGGIAVRWIVDEVTECPGGSIPEAGQRALEERRSQLVGIDGQKSLTFQLSFVDQGWDGRLGFAGLGVGAGTTVSCGGFAVEDQVGFALR